MTTLTPKQQVEMDLIRSIRKYIRDFIPSGYTYELSIYPTKSSTIRQGPNRQPVYRSNNSYMRYRDNTDARMDSH